MFHVNHPATGLSHCLERGYRCSEARELWWHISFPTHLTLGLSWTLALNSPEKCSQVVPTLNFTGFECRLTETAVTQTSAWAPRSSSLPPAPSHFSSHLHSRCPGRRAVLFHRGPTPIPSSRVSILHNIKGWDLTWSGERGGFLSEFMAWNLQQTLLNRVIFKENCVVYIFKICAQKQCLRWTPKTLWHDNTWRFLNSQLFSLWAICSAFPITPCLLAPRQLCLRQYAS